MGLFGSKKKTTVGTTVSRVVGETDIPNSMKRGVINSLFQEGDLTDFILEELIGSIAFKAERAYKYADTTYAYGLPSGEVISMSKGVEEAEVILKGIEGPGAIVVYSNFGPANSIHLSWMHLVDSLGYLASTNELTVLSAQKGFPVYLINMNIVMSQTVYDSIEPQTLQRWDVSPQAGYTPNRAAVITSLIGSLTHAPVILDPTVHKETARIKVCWEAIPDLSKPNNKVYQEQILNIVLPELNPDADYFQVKFINGNTTKYWIYESGTGTYPTLDALFDVPFNTIGNYFPFLYFRFGKQSMDKKKGTLEYSTSKKLAKYFGLDYASTIEAVHANPDIEDVEQAMMIMAVSPNSKDKEDLQYLFDYFNAQAAAQTPGKQSMYNISLAQMGLKAPSSYTTVIADARFKMSLGNEGISKKLNFGKLGKVGSYHSAISYHDIQGEPIVDAMFGITHEMLRITTHSFRKQISEHVYEDIAVQNLRMTYHIYGKHSTVGDDKDPILLIPLDRSITKKYPLSIRENLYTSSMHYVFNSRIVTKVKWYQSSFFSFVIAVVAMVIGAYFLGPKLVAFNAALAAGSITLQSILMTVAMGILESVVMQEIIKIFVKAVGLENAFFLAILSMAVMAGLGAMNGGFSKMPWGETLLKISNGLMTGVNKAFTTATMDLQEEYEQFGLYVQEQNDILKEQMDLLKGNNLLNPFIVFGESPNDFYNRTVHSGNIGVIGISAVKHYVPNALTLPKLNETLGDNDDAV